MSSLVDEVGPHEENLDSPPTPLWRNTDYLLLWAGQAVSTTGSGLSGLAFPLLVLAVTHSPAQAGFVAAVFGLPYLLISLPAGAYIDRWNRKRVMIVCEVIRAINMGTIPIMAAAGHLTAAQLYLNSAIEGTAFVFFNVAETAALPRVVHTSQIPDASSQNQAAQAAAALISPPLGGFLFQAVGRTFPFLADAISYAISLISLLFIKTEFQLERKGGERRLLEEIGEGLNWLWNQPLVRFMTFLTGGLNFVGNATFLILLILAKQSGASPSLIGIMFAISAVGGLAGAIVAPRFQRRFGFAQVILVTTWISVLVVPFFALAPNVYVLGTLGAIGFMVGPIYNAVQFSYRMAIIPDELQGRVNSAVRMVAFGTIPLGSAIAGVLIQVVGAVSAVLILGAAGIALALVASFNRDIREARSNPEAIPA